MNIKNAINNVSALAGVLALSLAVSTFAGPQVEEKVMVKVVTDSGDTETIQIENLAIGEHDYYVTESGKEVYIERNDSGYTIDVDGETIDVNTPHMETGSHHKRIMLHEGDISNAEIQEKLAAHGIVLDDLSDGKKNVMIISGDGDVAHFDDTNEMVFMDESGERHVIVKKAVLGDEGAHWISNVEECIVEFEGDLPGDINEEEFCEQMQHAHGEMEVNVEVLDGADDEQVIIIKKHKSVTIDNLDEDDSGS